MRKTAIIKISFSLIYLYLFEKHFISSNIFLQCLVLLIYTQAFNLFILNFQSLKHAHVVYYSVFLKNASTENATFGK